MNLKGRSFLTLKDFTPEEITYLLELAATLKEKKKQGITGNSLKGKKHSVNFLRNHLPVPDAHLRLDVLMKVVILNISEKMIFNWGIRRVWKILLGC